MNLVQKAIEMRRSGEWLNYLQSKDKPCNILRKYKPGDIVKSHGCGRISKMDYVYIGSFRSRGRYGLYLLLNDKGYVRKHDNIAFPGETERMHGFYRTR
jgi:hypothetical protein